MNTDSESEQPEQTTPDVPAAGGSGGRSPNGWSETAKELEHYQRETLKWKKRYDEVRADALKVEHTLHERVDDLRKSEAAARTQLDHAHLRIKQLEEHYNVLRETTERLDAAGKEAGAELAAAHIATLMQSYQDLARNYDALLRQLAEKSEELQAVVELRTQVEDGAAERIRQMEERARREQEEADKARRRLAEMEQTHLALLSSYREMNDRFIRMHQTGESGKVPPAPIEPTNSHRHRRKRRR